MFLSDDVLVTKLLRDASIINAAFKLFIPIRWSTMNSITTGNPQFCEFF